MAAVRCYESLAIGLNPPPDIFSLVSGVLASPYQRGIPAVGNREDTRWQPGFLSGRNDSGLARLQVA